MNGKFWPINLALQIRHAKGQIVVAETTNARLAEKSAQISWDRARLSVVVPISVIVAVAIICIVFAVMTSAKRADEVALEHEKRLFSRAIVNYGNRILRELESVAANEKARTPHPRPVRS